MTGAIPSYGQFVTLERFDEWDPNYSHSVYRSRDDFKWYIRSDKTSKHWQIFFTDRPVGREFPSLTLAMEALTSVLDIVGRT